MLTITALLFCLQFVSNVHSGRILFVPAHVAASHTKSMYPAAEAFVLAGHQVHMLQLVDDKNECHNQAGVIDRIIRIPDQGKTNSDTMAGAAKIMWTTFITGALGIVFPWKMTTDACVAVLSDQDTRQRFHDIVNEPWDAVFIDDFFAPCGLLAVKEWSNRGITIIDFSTSVLLHSSLHARGVVPPWATMASFQLPTYNPGHFWYRFRVSADVIQFNIVDWFLQHLIPYWGIQGVSPDLLAHRSVLAVTAFTRGLDFVQATSPTVTSIDQPCPMAEPVPEPFKSFVEDPTSHGTILFAMGHYADWTYAPTQAIPAFIQAFATLSQYRIIWQFTSKSVRPSTIPHNVLMEPWVPQVAILNHPNTKLFISHMGLKSMRECICARVPSVAMPMFAEQYRNAAISRHRHLAGFIDKTNLTKENVYEAIQGVLRDHQYADAVHRLQDQLGHSIRSPLDLLIFRVEFLLRWKDERILNHFLNPRLTRLPSLTQWSHADLGLPFLAILVIFFLLLI